MDFKYDFIRAPKLISRKREVLYVFFSKFYSVLVKYTIISTN